MHTRTHTHMVKLTSIWSFPYVQRCRKNKYERESQSQFPRKKKILQRSFEQILNLFIDMREREIKKKRDRFRMYNPLFIQTTVSGIQYRKNVFSSYRFPKSFKLFIVIIFRRVFMFFSPHKHTAQTNETYDSTNWNLWEKNYDENRPLN